MVYCEIYVFTNSSEILIDCIVGNAENVQIMTLKKGCSFPVFFFVSVFVVLGSVQFDYQLCLGAVKVHNVVSDDFLS